MAINSGKEKTIIVNRKAFLDFNIHQRLEAGIALTGTEVKSAKDRKISLREGFCFMKSGELWLKNVHIAQYPFGNRLNHDPLRERKLLLHRAEIDKLKVKLREKGFTLIPLRVYVNRGRIKVELGLASGKRQFDKRDAIRRKDEKRELGRDFKASDLTGKLK